MLGSLQDADDALQDTLLGAWQGFAGFEGKSALRTWLFTIATHASLRLVARRPKRVVPNEVLPSADPRATLVDALDLPWLDPYPDGDLASDTGSPPDARYEALESVELAFVAALQHLPARQRAALILSDVLGFTAHEAAASLETSVASINSALQRARDTLARTLPSTSQQATRRALGDDRHRALVERFVDAWRRADVDAIVATLSDDATFTMPPLPAWFLGREDIRTFLTERVFALDWRMRACRVSGQPALAAYLWNDTSADFQLEVINLFRFRGEHVTTISAFPDNALCARFGLPRALPCDASR